VNGLALNEETSRMFRFRRAVCGIVAALALAADAAADVKRPAFVTEFLAVKAEAEAALGKLSSNLAAKNSEEAAARSVRESAEIMKRAAEKVLTAVRPHAAEPAAVEPLLWVVNQVHGTPLDDEAAGLLAKHHPTRKQTIELAYRFKKSTLPWIEPLLRAQLAAADLPAADRPRLLYALARVKQTQAALPATLAGLSAEELSLWEDAYGKTTVEGFRKIDTARAETEAVRLYTELGEKYGPQKLTGGLTCGELARSAVFEIRHLTVGKAAPEIEGEDTDGAKFKLSDYRGKVVLLVFWATWCAPCMREVPHEKAIAERFRGKPFALVGVNSDTDKSMLKERAAKEGIQWRSFWCGEKGPLGPIPLAWNVTGWPAVYVLDPNGIIRAKQVSGKRLDQVLDKVVGEVDAKK
jgi:thiol-disulfide isomerase/thioredoxin